MSRPKGSGSRLSELGYTSPKHKDLSWDPTLIDGAQDRRNGSPFMGFGDKDNSRSDEEKTPKSSTQTWTVEERLLALEREISQLNPASGAVRTLSEFDQEQSSEYGSANFEPKNEIVRVSSDDWHEKRGGKFRTPERSVLTVSTTSRHWAGRHAASAIAPSGESIVAKKPQDDDVPLKEVAPERPYRLAITGYALHRELEKIFGLPVAPANNVWIWPFKHFITYESRIRQRLTNVQAAVGEATQKRVSNGESDAKDETLEATAVGTPVTGLGIEAEKLAAEGDEEAEYASSVKLEGQLRCLVDFMNEYMKDIFGVKKEIENHSLKEIGFEHLWLLFKPGDIIFTSSAQKRAYVVLHVTGGRAILDIGDQPSTNNRSAPQPTQSWEQHEDQILTYAHSRNTPFLIDTFYIDFDGENFGPVPRRFVIQEYEGQEDITALPVYPAEFDENVKNTREMLKDRGKKFVELAGVAHRKYAGLTAREPSVADFQEEVNSDVVIDFTEAIKNYRKIDNTWVVGLGAGVVEQASRADRRETNEIMPCVTKGCTLCKRSDIFDDSYHDLERRSEFLDGTSLLRYCAYGKEDLDEEQIILLPPRVYGYSLLDRYWYPLNIDLVDYVASSSHNGFDDLVLPGDHKRIMQALVKNHTRGSRPTTGKARTRSEYTADLVKGKGRGLIILLHGVPGVGKTSTAECVAAQTKRPLFPITCGDIGTTAEEVERRLEEYFDLAHKWGCVLLLDEADVYLATREKGGDLQRNSLVSVFLRVLEYYSGILILTTNRVGEFDEAFKSRIHISLYYPRLNHESTIKIWQMNLARLERSNDEGNIRIDFDEDRIIDFAEEHWKRNRQKLTRRWNGRQIKNAFQTAIALATWDYKEDKEDMKMRRPKLTYKHFDVVSQTSAHFDDYLSKVHQIDEEETYGTLAAREGLRADDVSGWRRDSSTVKPSKRRNIRSDARDGSEQSEEDDDGGFSDEIGQKSRQREKDIRRRRKSSTKEEADDEDGRRQAKSNGRSRAIKEEDSDEEESEERPKRKSKPKRREYSEEEESEERPKRKSKPKKEEYSDEEEVEEKPRRKSKPKVEISDP